jgi:Raf kinase inhibitor-like YbhB/YbcL family protein
MALQLHSPAFAADKPIPVEYTCEGADRSPPLAWSGVPDGAVTLLVTCDDPDAPRGTFHHWAVFNIPAERDALSAGEPAPDEAINDFGRRGYGGPCPPRGHRPHRYVFRLAALNGRIDAPAGVRAGEVARLAAPLEIASASFTATFGR